MKKKLWNEEKRDFNPGDLVSFKHMSPNNRVGVVLGEFMWIVIAGYASVRYKVLWTIAEGGKILNFTTWCTNHDLRKAE